MMIYYGEQEQGGIILTFLPVISKKIHNFFSFSAKLNDNFIPGVAKFSLNVVNLIELRIGHPDLRGVHLHQRRIAPGVGALPPDRSPASRLPRARRG